jgi:hypothetical protein
MLSKKYTTPQEAKAAVEGMKGLYNISRSEANLKAMWNDTDTRAAFLKAAMDEAIPEIRLRGMKGLYNLTGRKPNKTAMWNDTDTRAAIFY